MLWFFVKRLVLLVPILVGVSLVTFVIARALPGDPARLFAGMQTSESVIRDIRAEYGFDRPLVEQYVAYLADLLHGDLGRSVRTRSSVAGDLMARAPATLELATAAILLAIIVGIPLGLASAIRPGKSVDQIGRGISLAGVAMPDFWIGLLLVYFFYAKLHIAPPPLGRVGGFSSGPEGPTGFFTLDALIAGDLATLGDALRHLALPAIALAIPAMAPLIRITRNAALDVLLTNYILFARSTGMPARRLYLVYVLRNTLPAAVTVIGLLAGYMIGGVVLVEKAFSWPGLGLYAANSLEFNDYPAIQGFVLAVAATYLVIFMLVDLANAIIDPRTRS
jgi:peptide/nickel transport system permease protein